jgi:hypothetical protein
VAAPAPAAGPAGQDHEPSAALVPGQRPPAPRAEGGAAATAAEEPDESRAPRAGLPGGPAVDPEAEARLAAPGGPACDACFADGSWMASPAVALGILAGHWAGQQDKAESRSRRRFLP